MTMRGCVTPKALLILALLTFQNCAVAIFLRYVRTRENVPTAHIGCVVLLQELVKFIISLAWCVHEVKESLPSYHHARGEDVGESGDAASVDMPPAHSSSMIHRDDPDESELLHRAALVDTPSPGAPRKGSTGVSYREITTHSSVRQQLWQAMAADIFNRQGLKLLIPSGLFSMQNALLFVAMSNLEPTMFLVLYQSKILTTGILMMLLLGRTFSTQKWCAMVVLLGGIVLTQHRSSGSGSGGTTPPSDRRRDEDITVGLTAVLVCSLSSSIAGVVMEKFMKADASSSSSTPGAAPLQLHSHLSTKNVHLSFFSLILVGVPVVFRVWAGADESFVSMLHGVDGVVWAMIMNQALGGILVALSLRHADNILKTFATTCAIVVGGVVSHFLFGFIPSAAFVLGTITVGCAIVLYAMPDLC